MNGRRKPRVPRVIRDPIEHAMRRACKYTQAEIHTMLAPVRQAQQALRTGVATEADWVHLASTVAICLSVEHKGVVRGLLQHLQAADQALLAIKRRALASGEWKPTALYFQELDLVNLLVELHEYQLNNLSAGEYEAAYDHAAADTQRLGGQVFDAQELQATHPIHSQPALPGIN